MLPEGQQLSHYRLVRLLKSGGMGEVYLAVDTLLHRQVAIKVIDTDALRYAETDVAKDAARLFLREAQAIAQLDHTNILPLYDSGEQSVNGTALMYMVMPYRQAGSLADWKRTHFEGQLLPLAAVERIVQQAALALQHAHDRQIIHQDVKPSNFLVHGDAEHPSRLHLQLADFGVAKFMMMTSESQVIRGTPTYMAPEQWDGHPVLATDQYALAVMAYELLTGRPPFMGNGYQQMWHQHFHVAPIPPSMINPTLPQELDAIFLRALEKNPERRYSSVSAFAHAFQRAVLNSGNVHQTLTITTLESRTGSNRLLPLPGGRQVMVPIPPGVNHGQVIRLEGFGRPTTYNNPVGALIITIFIDPVVAEEAVSPTTATFQHTIPVSTSLARNDVRSTLPPVPFKKRNVKGKSIMVMSMAFVLVFLSGMIGFYSVINTHAPASSIQGNKTNVTATPTSEPATKYPSYLPGNGTLALYDPMKDDSKGNNWAPLPTPSTTPSPIYGSCNFIDSALHVKVDGSTGVTFHPCFPEALSTPSNSLIFVNFAYQVKMTFVTGDCGGVTFRGQGDKFYYFFICQNSNYPCHYNSSQACNYGLIRYTQDPPSGMPDFTINPLLTEGFSKTISDGAHHQYTIAVVAQGPKIDLYVNSQNQSIAEVSDNYYSTGKIGVLAKTFGTDMTEVA
ncbi:MAG TPA: protein kinase, partial [Ktedonobacteraceae bacterium]